ncbi:MAG: hypothetical protein WCI57_02515 [Candidatus Berkelbacteria bacterium]
MTEPFAVGPIVVDLTNFTGMYELGVIAQRKRCEVRTLIIEAIIVFNLVHKGENVPPIPISQMPACDPDNLDVIWTKSGYLSLPSHYAEMITNWSTKRYGIPDGLETALVREAISYFLEIVYDDDELEEFEVEPDLALKPDEFLLTEEAYIMLVTLADDEEHLAEALATWIFEMYSEIEVEAQIIKSETDDIAVDHYLVVVSERYRIMLEAIAAETGISRSLALIIVIECVWDESEYGESVLIFIPK